MRFPILFPATCLLVVASCDPRVFDDLKETAWVNSDGQPGDLDSDDFGVGLVNGGTDGPLRYFVASGAPPAITRATFGDDRVTDSVSIRDRPELTLAESLSMGAAIAGDPGNYAGARGNIAVAAFGGHTSAPSVKKAYLYMLRADSLTATVPFEVAGDAMPAGIAFGNTDASGRTDLLATAGSQVTLIADYQDAAATDAGTSCDLGGKGASVLVSDSQEVLLAVDGAILVTTGSGLVTAADADCFDATPASLTVPAPNSEPDFGDHMALGDFDGDNTEDLVVTAPTNNGVYVFFNWKSGTPSATKLAVPKGSVALGSSIAVGDFNEDGRDELVVGDPQRQLASHPSAGAVYIFQADSGGSFKAPIELHDTRPEDNQVFGQSVAIAHYEDNDILVVGANNEVFTYFRTPVDGDTDSRVVSQ